MACSNVAWLAWAACLDGNRSREPLLQECVEKAKTKNDRLLLGELYRVQGLIKWQFAELDQAKKLLGDSLDAFEGLSLEQMALTRTDLANVLVDLNSLEQAECELDGAAALYQVLGKNRDIARIEASKVRIFLARSDKEKANQQRQRALELAPADHAVASEIGDAWRTNLCRRSTPIWFL